MWNELMRPRRRGPEVCELAVARRRERGLEVLEPRVAVLWGSSPLCPTAFVPILQGRTTDEH
jgi:hypothetical protein